MACTLDREDKLVSTMGTCVSRCNPCSSSSPSTPRAGNGDDSISLCGGSPTLSHNRNTVAVHPLPLASSSPAPTPSTSSSFSSLSAASSFISTATTSSASSASSAGYLKVRNCRDTEVVVLDPNHNFRRKKKKLASAAPRPPCLPRTPLSVVKSPTKKKPGSGTSNNVRRTSPTAAARRVRPLPPRPPPAAAGAGHGAGSRKKKRPSPPSSSSCRSAHSGERRATLGAAEAAGAGCVAGVVGGGELVDDLNNPVMSMDCFIFL